MKKAYTHTHDMARFTSTQHPHRCLSDESLHQHHIQTQHCLKATSTPNVSKIRKSLEDSGYTSLIDRSAATPSLTDSLKLEDIRTPCLRSCSSSNAQQRLESRMFSSTPFVSPIHSLANRLRSHSLPLECDTHGNAIRASMSKVAFDHELLPRLDLDFDVSHVAKHDSGRGCDLITDSIDDNAHELSIISEPIETPPTKTNCFADLSSRLTPHSAVASSHNEHKTDYVHDVCKPIKELPEPFSDFLKEIVLDRLIGRKMGDENVDILRELDSRNMTMCVSKILSYLHADDLCRLCEVSRDHKASCYRDKSSMERLSAIRRRRRAVASYIQKENMGRGSSSVKTKRALSSSQEPLTKARPLAERCQQETVETRSKPREPSLASMKQPFDKFVQAASQLRREESLQKCPRCESPSRVLQRRAVCFNANCVYDYCVECRLDYHGGSPCVVARRTSTTPSMTVCGRKSKRNLKRL